MKKPNLLVSAAALIRPGEILLGQRPLGKPLAGLWELPGGKIEAFETPEEALVRELSEEIGIKARTRDLTPLTFISHDCEKFHLLMPVFALYEWEGDPMGRENQALRWVGEKELFELDMPAPDLPLRPLLRDTMRNCI